MTDQGIDPGRCPLCGARNECGIEAGMATCWCFSEAVPPTVSDRIPKEARGVACVCRNCAKGKMNPEKLQETIERINRDR